LPSFTALKLGGPFHVIVSPILNLQVATPFDAIVPLFPSFVQPSSNGSMHHVDFATTSSENVVILSDLPYTKSNLDLLHVHPLQKWKKSYDHTKKFLFEWVAKLLWAKGVLVTNGMFHNVRCKVYTH
jgi:hypothetical protein